MCDSQQVRQLASDKDEIISLHWVLDDLKMRVARLELAREAAQQNEVPKFELGEFYSHPNEKGTYIYCGINKDRYLIFTRVNAIAQVYMSATDIDGLKKWRTHNK